MLFSFSLQDLGVLTSIWPLKHLFWFLEGDIGAEVRDRPAFYTTRQNQAPYKGKHVDEYEDDPVSENVES